jgi:hypothetical protein
MSSHTDLRRLPVNILRLNLHQKIKSVQQDTYKEVVNTAE